MRFFTVRRAVRRPAAGPLFIAAQFVPMAVLAIAYLNASTQIETATFGGVRLDRLLLTSAIIAPILSQSVSGPLFRGLEIAPHDRFGQSAALTLRHLPRAMIVAAPILIGMAVLTASALGMDYRGTLALVAVVWVHVLFSATLVPAYAHRQGGLLVLAWTGYAVVLTVAPQQWWAPAVGGFATQLVVLLHTCETRLPAVPVAPYRQMLAGMGRGLALALPLWCVPVTVYLASDGVISPVAIFLSLTPALLAYQVYFVQIATPVWHRIDRARAMLADDTYSAARIELLTIDYLIRSGLVRVMVLLTSLLLVGGSVAYLQDPTQVRSLFALMITAGMAVLVIAEVTRLSMVKEDGTLYLVSAAIVGALLVGAATGLDARSLIAVHLAACTSALMALRVANRSAWRSPEYSLFWSTALGR